ncbi:MAG TPA: RluA family pseudouridine synthase [Vicinamibacteria bacterium]|nr:RluA family pseudouridine synthase [Vicinamibacteria bacterium]
MAGEWLGEKLERPPSRSAVRRLIMAGALRVRGRPLRAPAWTVERGVSLEAEIGPMLLPPRPAPAPLDPGRVLSEDEALIAVDKPPGLPTVATADPERPHLVLLVTRLLASRPGAPARPYLGVHQRLDRDTSGVVLFAKDPAANESLAAQFAARSVRKTYVALTARPPRLPPEAWRVDRSVDLPAASPGERPRAAVTDFRRLEVRPGGLVVEARPHTGRKHQIRIHLAGASLPIFGDRDYGGPAGVARRVMLHAARLELRHPISGVRLAVASPLPDDFRAVLAVLRRAPAVPPARRRRP